MNRVHSLAMVASFLTLAACTSEATSSDLPETEEGLEASQTIYNTNADGTWSASAQTPWLDDIYNPYYMKGGASFGGPSGKTRKMGVCLLEKTGTVCNTVADCGSSPASLPTGGSRYCSTLNGTGSKYCMFRPGTQTAWCAGSPALGGTAVAPGSYQTNWMNVPWQTPYVSYACFEGCTASDPSSSSVAKLKDNRYCLKYPFDPNCL